MTLFDGEPDGDGKRDLIVIYFDGGARGNPGPAAIGAVVLDPLTDRRATRAVSEYIGKTTNNVAEYRALIAGLEAARAFPARRVRVRGDSMLVLKQVLGEWRVKQPHLRPLLEDARRLLAPYEDADLGQCGASRTPTPTCS